MSDWREKSRQPRPRAGTLAPIACLAGGGSLAIAPDDWLSERSRIGLVEDEPDWAEEAADAATLAARLEDLHGRSFGWALACCGWEREEAADVLQAAYLKVLDGRAVFGGRSRLSTWFFGVIRVTAIERRRKRMRRRILLFENQRLVEPTASDSSRASSAPPLEQEHETDTATLRRALATLPRRQQEVLHLVFYLDLSIREAAGVMKVGLGTARIHYDRAKKRLRQRLEEADQ